MEFTHYVNYRCDTCKLDSWNIESNGDIADLATLAPVFSRCESLKCHLRITANVAMFSTDDKFRLCYHPTRGTTVETPVVAIQTLTRLIDGIKSVIDDYGDVIESVMEQFLQNDFVEGEEE